MNRLILVLLLALTGLAIWAPTEAQTRRRETAAEREAREQRLREIRERTAYRRSAENNLRDQNGSRATRTQKDVHLNTKKGTKASALPKEVSGGAKKVASSYSSMGGNFSRMNHYLGGVWANETKRHILKERLENDIKDGKDPREVFETAFGPYVTSGTARYADRGQTIVWDPSLTALDKTLAMYDATKGGDVPRLKDYMGGRNVEVHVHMDQSKRDQVLKKIKKPAFSKIYSDELATRQANPSIERFTIKTQKDADKLSQVLSKKLPQVKGTFQMEEGSTFDLTLLDANPQSPRMLPGSGWVMIEYSPMNMGAFAARQGQTFNYSNNGRYLRVYKSLEEVTDQQLALADAIHVSASNFANLQNRMSRPADKETEREILAMMDDLDMIIYQNSAVAMGLQDETPVKVARSKAKNSPKNASASNSSSKPSSEKRVTNKRFR